MDESIPSSFPSNLDSLPATDSNLESLYIADTNNTEENRPPEEEDDDYEFAKTTAEVLSDMKKAWVNEHGSPILLPHKYETVECLLDQLDGMEQNIDNCKNKISLKVAAHRLEVLRIGYIVNDYVRLRLEKLEENSRGVLKRHNRRIKEGRSPLLSEEELHFAAKYAQAEAKLLGNTFLAELPPPFRRIPVPDIDTQLERVFAQVTTDDAEAVDAPDYQDKNADVIIELPKDSVHLIPFDSVQDHVENGKVMLM